MGAWIAERLEREVKRRMKCLRKAEEPDIASVMAQSGLVMSGLTSVLLGTLRSCLKSDINHIPV